MQGMQRLSHFIWYQLFNLSIPFLSPFPIPMNGHKQKPTIAPLSIYARNTLCLPQLSIFFSFYLSYITVQNYHRWSTYRSDQIEQYDFLTSNKRISTISTVLALVPVASAWTTTTFPPTYPSFLLSRLRQQQYHCSSYGTNKSQQTVAFLLPDFNDSNGVGTCTSCCYLDYHLHLLPILFQGTGGDDNNNHLSFHYYSIIILRITNKRGLLSGSARFFPEISRMHFRSAMTFLEFYFGSLHMNNKISLKFLWCSRDLRYIED